MGYFQTFIDLYLHTKIQNNWNNWKYMSPSTDYLTQEKLESA